MPNGPNARAPAILPITKAVPAGVDGQVRVGEGAAQFKRLGQFLEAEADIGGPGAFFGRGLDAQVQALGFQVNITGAENARSVGIQQ